MPCIQQDSCRCGRWKFKNVLEMWACEHIRKNGAHSTFVVVVVVVVLHILGKRYFLIAYIPRRTLCFVKSGVENSFNMSKTQKQTKYSKKRQMSSSCDRAKCIMFLTPSKPRFSSTYFVYIFVYRQTATR